MKKIIWEGTDDWDTLLLKRAAVSGELVLSAGINLKIKRSV
jgi:methylglutaconyl-CoA hydratase